MPDNTKEPKIQRAKEEPIVAKGVEPEIVPIAARIVEPKIARGVESSVGQGTRQESVVLSSKDAPQKSVSVARRPQRLLVKTVAWVLCFVLVTGVGFGVWRVLFGYDGGVPMDMSIERVGDEKSYGHDSLAWSKVKGASGYSVKMDGVKRQVSTNKYDLTNLAVGKHMLSVASVKGGQVSEYSEEMEYTSYGKVTVRGNGERGQDSGLLGAMDEYSQNETYLGRGFDIITRSTIRSRDKKPSRLFDYDGLLNQPVTKERELNTRVIDTSGSSVEEYQSKLNTALNVNSSWLGGSGTLNGGFGTEDNGLTEKEFKMLDAYVQYYNFTLESSDDQLRSIVTPGFLKDWQNPQISAADLMDRYGTHFLIGASMGGRIQSEYYMQSENRQSIMDVSLAMSLQFNYGTGSSGGDASVDWRSEAKDKKVAVSTRIESLGGNNKGEDGSYLDFTSDDQVRTKYGAWFVSVENSPALMGIPNGDSLKPLWDLIDPNLDSPKYQWKYEDGRVESLTRSAQLQAYFAKYGMDAYIKMMESYGKTVVLPKKIESVTVGGKEAEYDNSDGVVRSVYYITPQEGQNEQISIDLVVMPQNAIGYNTSFSVQYPSNASSTDWLLVSDSGVINIKDGTPLGEVASIVIGAGGISQRITVKTAKKYGIVFDANGGKFGTNATGDITTKTRVVDHKESVNSPGFLEMVEPVLDGYALDRDKLYQDLDNQTGGVQYKDGWQFVDSDGLLRDYQFGYEATQDIVLYAKWKKTRFEFLFDANGGVFADGTTQNTVSQEGELKDWGGLGNKNPTRTPEDGVSEYTFVGWSLDPNNDPNKLYDWQQVASQDQKVYAVWTAARVYTITLDLDGGYGLSTNLVVEENQAATKPQDPQKDWVQFLDWVDASGEAYDWQTPVTKNFVLKATWSDLQSRDIVFDLQGGTGSDALYHQQIPDGGKITKPATIPQKPNHKFLHWSTATNGYEYDWNASVTPSSPRTLFANYQRTAYTVNFDLNGGDGALSPAQVPVGERLARPQSPS
ncbi:MAG: InlB B-repeat-containing protein, partial [Firmicutes bacterium]|nr:InlB B-repeat-containing protein [Bacillota bacterium]